MRALRCVLPSGRPASLTDQLVFAQFSEAGLPRPETEVRFHPARRWRLDYASVLPDGRRLALEVEGGVWVNGRHNRAQTFLKDAEKYNWLSCAGYVLIRLTPDQVRQGLLRDWLVRAKGGA